MTWKALELNPRHSKAQYCLVFVELSIDSPLLNERVIYCSIFYHTINRIVFFVLQIIKEDNEKCPTREEDTHETNGYSWLEENI